MLVHVLAVSGEPSVDLSVVLACGAQSWLRDVPNLSSTERHRARMTGAPVDTCFHSFQLISLVSRRASGVSRGSADVGWRSIGNTECIQSLHTFSLALCFNLLQIWMQVRLALDHPLHDLLDHIFPVLLDGVIELGKLPFGRVVDR